MADPSTPTVESRMLIDGRLVDGANGTFDVVNPATEETLGAVADASNADMHRAIDAARRAFDGTTWPSDHALRQRCLRQLQEALVAEQEQLREELIREAGCPRATTYGPQLDAPLSDALTYPADLIGTYPWETDLDDTFVALTGVNTTRKVLREPAGVVGAIVPWNFPFEVTLHKLGQALATGNTVVLKPAPDTPFNATRIGRLIAEQTDIPAGVVNIVTAADHLIGEELTLSPKVDLISFTGSTAVGQRIMEKGAATMKRLFLELGGKSATIVCDDADLATACTIGVAPCLHAGQGCAIPTRLLLPRSRYAEGVAQLQAIYNSVVPGDPQDPATLCGPVISAKQRDRILGYIRTGIDEGATLLVGGTQQPDGVGKGFWVRPTLFTDVDPSMTIAQEEIFGPVLVVIGYDDDDDAVRIANDTRYGLAGNVMSGSFDRALALGRRLRAGFVGLNGAAAYSADVPFGGYKSSGIGRQNGTAGFDQYTEVKSVAYPAIQKELPMQLFDDLDDFGTFDDVVSGDVRDPYTELARLRREEPVQRIDMSTMPGDDTKPLFIAYRHDDIRQILRDNETFSSAIIIQAFGDVLGRHVMLGMDEPEHGRHRALVSKAFTQKALARWEDGLLGRVGNDLIDRFAAAGSADLVKEFTFPYPTQIIAGLLGLPREDFRQFQQWSISLLSFTVNPERGKAASLALEEYFAPILAARRDAPHDDVISRLAVAEIDGQRLSDEEIFSFLRLLLPAGVETTYRSLGNLLFGLFGHPDQLAAVRADRSLIPQAIEEAVRWEAPLLTITRVATRDTELSGVVIPAGSSVMPMLGAANREEDRYDEPDSFDIFRPARPSISWGHGAHVCLGMHLARLEMRVAIELLLDRLPELRLDPAAEDLHIRGQVFRSPASLPVLFTATGAAA